MLLEMGQVLLDSGKILGGLAILEDGFDKCAELHAVAPADILSREPRLLEHHRFLLPKSSNRRAGCVDRRIDRQNV